MKVFERLCRADDGAALPEYALVLAVLSLGLMAVLAVFGTTSNAALASQAARFAGLQTGP